MLPSPMAPEVSSEVMMFVFAICVGVGVRDCVGRSGQEQSRGDGAKEQFRSVRRLRQVDRCCVAATPTVPEMSHNSRLAAKLLAFAPSVVSPPLRTRKLTIQDGPHRQAGHRAQWQLAYRECQRQWEPHDRQLPVRTRERAVEVRHALRLSRSWPLTVVLAT